MNEGKEEGRKKGSKEGRKEIEGMEPLLTISPT